MLDKLLERIREAGAPSEDATERDGFLSNKNETHSVGYGTAIGFAIAAKVAGIPLVLELVVLALGGIGAKRGIGNERVMREITTEPQYFLPSIVVGAAIGAGVFVALGVL